MSTRTRPVAGQVESRTAAVQVDGRRIRGVIPYGVESRDLGGFTEVIDPGALRDADVSELRALIDHKGVPLGRYPTTLEVEDRADAFAWSVDPPKSRADVVEAVERGDVRSGSWRMVVADGGERWVGDVRHVTRIKKLIDVTLAAAEDPAYPAATVEYRTTTTAAGGRREEQTMPEGTTAATEAANENERTEERTTTEERTEERTSTEERTEERTTERANGGGGLRVEDRNERPESRTVDPWDAIWQEVRKVEKGRTGVIEARTLSTAVAISQPELSTRLFDRLRPRSVVLRSGVTALPIENDSVTYPRLSADAAPAWYAEGATITPGDPTFNSDTVVPQKVAHLVELNNEVVDDSEPSVLDVVRDHLLTVLGLKIDLGLLEGNGTPPNPLGFRSVSGIQTISTLGANGLTPINLDAWTDAVNALEAVNAEAITAFMHSRSSGTLRKLKKGPTGNIEPLLQGSAREMLRAPLGIGNDVSNQMSIAETQGSSADCSSSYVIDTARVFVVRRLDVTIEVDRSRLFNQDKSEIRAKARVNLYVPEGAAIARIVGIRAV